MAAVMKYDPKDVPAFQEQVCRKECIMKGRCIEKGQDNHWFLMCPHYHQWKLKIPDNWIQQQLKWERAHPEEAAANHQAEVEKAKAWKESQKKSKTAKAKKDEQDKPRSTKSRKKTS